MANEERELIRLELEAVAKGFEGVQGHLNALQNSLNQTIQSLKAITTIGQAQQNALSGVSRATEKAASTSLAHSTALGKEIEQTQKLTQTQKEAKRQMTDYDRAWQNLVNKRVQLAPKQMIGGTKEVKEFQRIMANIMPHANNQTLSGAISNIRSFHTLLKGVNAEFDGQHRNLLVGIADQRTLQGAVTGTGMSFAKGLTNVQKFRLELDNIGAITKEYSYHIQNLGKNMQWTGRQMMVGLTLPITLFGVKAVQTFVDINTEFTRMTKVLGAGTTKQDIDELTKAAQDMGQKFGAATKDVATLFADLAAQGVGEGAIKGFADEILRIASLGDIDVTVAKDFFRSISTIFVRQPHIDASGKLVGGVRDLGEALKQTKDIMNIFNAIENNTAINLQDLAAAMPEVAQSANLFGLSAGQTAGILAGMYQNGIDVTEAAHGLKFILQRIINPTDEASEKFKEFAESAGIALDLDQIAHMSTGIEKLEAISTVIGKLDTVSQQRLLGEVGGLRQANRFVTLLRQVSQGREQVTEALKAINAGKSLDQATKGMNDYAKSIVVATMNSEDLRKAAERELKIKLESPETQLARAKQMFETFLYNTGKVILPVLQDMFNTLNKALNWLSNMPDPFKKFVVGLGLFLAAIGPVQYALGQVGLVFGTLGVGVGKLIWSLDEVNPQLGSFGKNIAQVGTRLRSLDKKNFFTRFFDAFSSQGSQTAALMNDLKLAIEAQTAALVEQATAHTAAATAAQTQAAAEAELLAVEQMKLPLQSPAIVGTPVDTTLRSKLLHAAPHTTGINMQQAVDHFNKKQAAALSAKTVDTQLHLFDPGVGTKRTAVPTIAVGGGVKAAASGAGEAVGIFARLKGVITGILPALGRMLLMIAKIGTITAVVSLVVLAIVGAIRNFDKFKDKMQSGLKAIRAAWKGLIGAIGGVIDAFKKAFASLGEKGSSPGKDSFWTGIGDGINAVLELIAVLMDAFTGFINFMEPVWSTVASSWANGLGGLIALIKSVVALFKGDWGEFFSWLGAAVQYIAISWVHLFTPAFAVIDALVRFAVSAINVIISMINKVSFGLAGIGKINLGKGFSTKQGVLDLIGKPRNIFERSKDVGKPIGKEASDGVKKGIEEGFADGAAAGGGGDGGGDGAVDDILDGFLSSLKSRLRQALDDIKEQAMEALRKSHEARLKIFDDQIKAIEDLEEAEKKLLRTQEYLADRKRILDEKDLNRQNYMRDRALAIYEGRIDDARMLDLEHLRSEQDSDRELSDLDADRAREMLQEARDAQKKALEEAKKAQEELFKLEEESFEKRLELILQYEPRTIEELKGQIDAINELLGSYGVAKIGDGYDMAFGTYRDAILNAAEDMKRDAFFAGKDFAAAWILGFANSLGVGLTWENLFGRDSGGGGGGGGGGGAGDFGGGDFMSPDEAAGGSGSKVNVGKQTSIFQGAIGEMSSAKKRANELREELARLQRKFDENIVDMQKRTRIAAQMERVEDKLKDAVHDHQKAVDNLESSFRKVVRAAPDAAIGMIAWAKANGASNEEVKRLTSLMANEMTGSFKSNIQGLHDLRAAHLELAPEIDAVALKYINQKLRSAESRDEQLTMLENVKKKYPELNEEIDKHIQKILEKIIMDSNGSKDALKNLDDLRDRHPGLRDQISQTMLKQIEAHTTSIDGTKAQISYLEEQKKKYPDLAAEIDILIGKYKNAGEPVITEFDADTELAQQMADNFYRANEGKNVNTVLGSWTQPAWQAANDFINGNNGRGTNAVMGAWTQPAWDSANWFYGNWNNRWITFNAALRLSEISRIMADNPEAFFAMGGNIKAGTMSIVGEAGRELFVPKVDGTIIRSQDTVSMLRRMKTSFSAPNAPSGISGNVSASSSAGSDPTIINENHYHIGTVVGQKEWFKGQMGDYNRKVSPHKQRSRGTINRKMKSYGDNAIRYRE